MNTSLSSRRLTPRSWSPADWLGLAVLSIFLVVGLTWAKWVPYWGRTKALVEEPVWSNVILFDAAGESPSLSGAWNFTVLYFGAIWKALLVALLVGAAIESLIRRDWLVRVMNRSSPIRQASVAAALSMPSMMCTCCAAPVASGLRRSGVHNSAALAFWVGNPLLNPAVLVFLALVLPWQYVAVRVFAGFLIAVGASSVVGRWFPGRTDAVGELENLPESTLAVLPERYFRSLLQSTRVVLPEHLVTVFAIGLISPWLTGLFSVEAQFGIVAVLVAAIVGTLLVIPTAGEIPIIMAVVAAGMGTGMAGALLITLPALSLPSMIMVRKAMGVKATGVMAVAVILIGVLAGILLATIGG